MSADHASGGSSTISIIGLKGMPEIRAGDDLGLLIVRAAEEQGVGIRRGDIVVVTQKGGLQGGGAPGQLG